MEPFQIKITDLIPQRPPIVMIDRLNYADEKSAIGELLITETNLFFTEGHLSEAGITEFIAQTSAAYKGYQRLLSGRDIKRGYIAAIKNLIIHSLPSLNTKIECQISIENELMGFTIVLAKVLCGKQVIAEAEMRIVIETQTDRQKVS
jgi:predicted hotdog family 3-hydroxylacyl-ACP dehydratase